MKTDKSNKSWGGQGNGKGGYYAKKEIKSPSTYELYEMTQKKTEFPYPGEIDEMLQNTLYLKDRAKLFKENGNGWWCTVHYGYTPKR